MAFAAWTTNINNRCSASLSIARTVPNVRDRTITPAAGLLGTLPALAGIMDHFVRLPILLGIIVPPIAGIHPADCFLIRPTRVSHEQTDAVPKFRWIAIVSQAVACFVGFIEKTMGIASSWAPTAPA